MKILNKYLETIKKCDCGNNSFYLTNEYVYICTKCKKRHAGYNLIEKKNELIEIIITDVMR